MKICTPINVGFNPTIWHLCFFFKKSSQKIETTNHDGRMEGPCSKFFQRWLGNKITTLENSTYNDKSYIYIYKTIVF